MGKIPREEGPAVTTEKLIMHGNAGKRLLRHPPARTAAGLGDPQGDATT